jgi:hypothetical protein
MVMYVFLRKDKKILRFSNFFPTILCFRKVNTKTLEVFSEVILQNCAWFLKFGKIRMTNRFTQILKKQRK